VVYTIEDEAPIEKNFSHVLLGTIPLMVHSDGCVLHQQGPQVLKAFDECPYDQGGYFIVDGKEKVVISQERMVTNRLFIEKAKDPAYTYKTWIRCATDVGEAALLPKTVEFYIYGEESAMRGAVVVSVPGMRGKIPLFQLFRALGIESDKSIIEHIYGPVDTIPQSYVDFILPSVRHCGGVYDQIGAVEGLMNSVRYKSVEHVHAILSEDIFPNMGVSYHAKARFLGYLIRYMTEMILGVKPMVDRDGFGYKRMDLSGFLISQLFHNVYKRFRKNCRDLLDQEYHYGPTRNTGNFEDMIRKENIQKIISPSFITERLVRSLKGLWGSSDEDEKQEKVQDLARISYIGFLSNLRRVNTPLDRSIKITSPHRLNAQQWGILCPFESPDGASIGYLKNMALLCHVTFGTNPEDLTRCLDDLDMVPLLSVLPSMGHVLCKVFLNGVWVGCVVEPDVFVKKMRLLRRNGCINVFTSVAWKIHLNEIRIHTDAGRGCRPLIIIENGKHFVPEKINSWFELVIGGGEEKIEEMYYRSQYISPFDKHAKLTKEQVWTKLEKEQCPLEFVDIEEEDSCMIAMYPKDITGFTTHLEIHPSTILSVVTSNIPFANHNFAPRLIFYGAQSKQAVGIYTTNFNKRFDTMSYILHYSNKPLITTHNSHYIANDKLPAGFNTIVAIMTYSGYNQEDGVMINRNSIERGLFQITAYKSYSAQESAVNEREYIMFVNPLKLKNEKHVTIDNLKAEEAYALLDDDGIIIAESFVPKGSKMVVVGMVRVKEQMKEIRTGVKLETRLVKTYTDVSLRTGVHHYGVVDKVYVGRSGPATDYNRVCKVRFRKMRLPEFGDKVCSRHGQKGVVGLILNEEDMPFNKDGVKPDIIINPHAIPSRMTIGHLVECVYAKLCSLNGAIGDGSVFVPLDLDVIGGSLEKHGFEKRGNEVLYNGRTGRQIDTEVFFGPTYYLRLKHMVADKLNARAGGPRDQLTRQPPSGRSKEGGLRIGEMERDVLLSYGFSQFAKESMMERSDKYTWSVCRMCGRAAVKECFGCGSSDIAVVQTPYAFKLLVQEMETMGVTPRFVTDEIPVESDEDDMPALVEEEEVPMREAGEDEIDVVVYGGGWGDEQNDEEEQDDEEEKRLALKKKKMEEEEEEEGMIIGGEADDLEEEQLVSGGQVTENAEAESFVVDDLDMDIDDVEEEEIYKVIEIK
jgi:DNA-directed RNA polymerase II subunit RPB2